MFPIGDLRVEVHLERQRHAILGLNAESDLYFTNFAYENHTLIVKQALLEARTKIMAYYCKDDPGFDQINFGLARRLGLLWSSYSSLLSIAPPGRVAPLSIDQANDLMRDINTIYINLYGSIDNISWFIFDRFGDESAGNLQNMQVSIFHRKFYEQPSLARAASQFSAFEGWFKDLKKHRDPAAHRIPLSVPPRTLTSEQLAEYQALEKLYWEKFAVGDYQAAERLQNKQMKMGSFVAAFVSAINDEPVAIHPTVSEDIGTLMAAVDVLFTKVIKST